MGTFARDDGPPSRHLRHLPVAPSGSGSVTTQIGRDALGRITHYREYGQGSTSFERTGITAGTDIAYDRANRALSEASISTRSDGVYRTELTNTYSGGQLSSQTQHNYKGGVDSAAPDTYQSYGYTWWDGAIQSAISFDSDTAPGSTNPDWTTDYSFDKSGHVTAATIRDGQWRDVGFVTDQNGMVIDRTEAKVSGHNTTSTGSPRGLHYMFAGQQIGTASNNGSDNTSYTTSIRNRLAVPPASPSPFAPGATASYDFDQNYDAINGTSVGSTGGSYTAQGGETLASVAQSVWGDASLWYLLADANGLSGSAELNAGQTITIPNKVINRHNTSDTFRPYDPNEALGDTSPTDAAKPPKAKSNKCGTFGIILLLVVAAAVSVVTAGAAVAAVTPGLSVLGGIGSVLGMAGAATVGAGTLIAAGVAGAVVGSVVSQGLGLITGIQQGGFSWKAVALAGLTAAVSGGIGALAKGAGGVASAAENAAAHATASVAANTVTTTLGHIAETAGKFAVGALRSAAISAATQGIATATGLQDKFDWGGVASAAIGGGLGASVKLPGGRVVNSVAGRIAGVGAQSLVSGTDFGDNLMHALPDIIGQTIGDLVTGAIARAANKKQSPAELALLDMAQKSANRVAAGANAHGSSTGYELSVYQQPAAGSGSEGASAKIVPKGTGPDWSSDDWKVGLSPESIRQAEMGLIRFAEGGPPMGGGADSTVKAWNSTIKRMEDTGAGTASVPKTGPFTVWDNDQHTSFHIGTEAERESILTADANRAFLATLDQQGAGPLASGYVFADPSYDLSTTVSVPAPADDGHWYDGIVGRYDAVKNSISNFFTYGPWGGPAPRPNDYSLNTKDGRQEFTRDLTDYQSNAVKVFAGYTMPALQAGRPSMRFGMMRGPFGAGSGVPAALERGTAYEAERLGQLGIPKNNVVWRPGQTDFDSAAFKVIVGKPKFTPGGLPKGTIFDGTLGGNLEIKGGSSMLDSSYQLRLQAYRSLKTNTPLRIETTRPVNPAFRSWLDRWGVSVVPPK